MKNPVETTAGSHQKTQNARDLGSLKKRHPDMRNWSHISGIPKCEANHHIYHVCQCPQTDKLQGKSSFFKYQNGTPSVNFEKGKNCWESQEYWSPSTSPALLAELKEGNWGIEIRLVGCEPVTNRHRSESEAPRLPYPKVLAFMTFHASAAMVFLMAPADKILKS